MAGFQNPEEFDAWKLSWELKERVVAFTATNPAARDREFCDEIRESARSAPDNISEGFYRFNPPDFANFVRIARGSLGEVKNQLRHAHSSKYLTDGEFGELSRLCRRAIGCMHGPSPLPSQPPERLRSSTPSKKNERLAKSRNLKPERDREPRT
jgi:four helix bundle protein